MEPSPPQLATPRLLLRQIEPADIDHVYRGLSHPDVIKYYGVSFDSLEATEEKMAWYRDLERNGTGIWWAICSLDNRVFYGAGRFNGLSKEHRKADFGCCPSLGAGIYAGGVPPDLQLRLQGPWFKSD